MNPFEMVVIVMGFILTAGILKHAINVRSSRPDHTGEQYAEQMHKIEARLKVLEKIVTSDGYDLKQQFKDLENDK